LVCLAILLTWPVVVFTRVSDYTVVELDTLPGLLVGEPLAINERGQIVGYLGFGNTHAVMWDDESVIDLQGSPGDNSVARDINNRGQVVGESRRHAALWEDGTPIDLGVLAGCCSDARGINNRGQIVGWSSTGIDGETHAVIWENGAIVDLGVLSGDDRSMALAINSRGQIVGISSTMQTGRAFMWDKGNMSELPGLDSQDTAAFDINDRGQVVGYSGSRPVMWEKDTLVPLDTLPPLTSGRAFGINNKGQIVGFLQSPTSSSRVPVLWQNGKAVVLPMLPPVPSFPNDYVATDIDNGGGTIIGHHVRSGFPLPLVWVRKAQPAD
jgi:probable HAF family extracellular repeat protein